MLHGSTARRDLSARHRNQSGRETAVHENGVTSAGLTYEGPHRFRTSRSFCHAVLERFDAGLREAGHSNEIVDLYAIRFDPILRERDTPSWLTETIPDDMLERIRLRENLLNEAGGPLKRFALKRLIGDRDARGIIRMLRERYLKRTKITLLAPSPECLHDSRSPEAPSTASGVFVQDADLLQDRAELPNQFLFAYVWCHVADLVLHAAVRCQTGCCEGHLRSVSRARAADPHRVHASRVTISTLAASVDGRSGRTSSVRTKPTASSTARTCSGVS
jgi:hypothetical protein